VSRAIAAVACVALLAALVIAPRPGGLASGSRAQAAECSWQRHSRRTFVKVRRHGRAQRVARVRHWWTCAPVTAAPVVTAPVTSPSPPANAAPTPAPEAEPTANRLGVKAAEYSYTLSRPSVEAGQVTIELNNQGEDAHNLNLRLEGGSEAPLQVAETGSQEHRTAHFDLPAGTYRLWCSLPEHDELGMHATLVVGGG